MGVLRKYRWLRWFGLCGVLWLAFVTDAEAQWLYRGDISLRQINKTWKEVRALLARHKHPQNRAILRKWKAMSNPSQSIVRFTPKGFLLPEWFADARRSTIWINTSYLKSLRRQFNNAVYYARQKLFGHADLDLVGAWGNIWYGLALQQHRRAKLRLLFALKLLPGFEYTRCRAHLQGMLQRRHGVYFSEETIEVALLCLHHKREVHRAILRHPILKRVWSMIYWRLTDTPLQRLDTSRSILPKAQTSDPSWRKACGSEAQRRLVASTYFSMRRFTCAFCPAYSIRPTATSVWISLVRGGALFTINREHYRSLLYGKSGEMLRLVRKQWHYLARYTNTFLRRLRAKGPRFMADRKRFERNLMVDQVRHYNWMLRENFRNLRRTWSRQTIRNFYKERIKLTFKQHKRIPACFRATEIKWIEYAASSILPWLHP